MRDYLPVEDSLQEAFRSLTPLMPAQLERITRLCVAVLLAAEITLSRLARQLPMDTDHASRERWITRLRDSPFLTQEIADQPFIRDLLAQHPASTWHVIIDRTDLGGQDQDLVTISVAYACRALPLIWQFVPFGGADVATYCALIRQCAPLLPPDAHIIFHGDSEFGSLAIVRLMGELGWDFMLAQKKSNHFWQPTPRVCLRCDLIAAHARSQTARSTPLAD